MTQLALIEKMNPLEIYGSNNIDTVLGKIGAEMRGLQLDISTDSGRKEVASAAYKIARSKTFLDDLGKKLGEEAKAKLDAINSERKKSRDYLDALKDEVRKPLTEWENAEKNRVDQHEAELNRICQLALSIPESVGEIEARLTSATSNTRDWQEFTAKAQATIATVESTLKNSLAAANKRAAEIAELQRLREAEAARIQKERDDKIAREAAERATKEAEERAAREQKIAEEKLVAVKLEKELSEKRAKEAAEAAEREKIRAVEAERKRIENERLLSLAAKQKREANKKHNAKINGEVLKAIQALGVDQETAKKVVTAIALGNVPHTKISY